MRLAALVLALAACGGGNPKSATPAATAPACGAVADAMVAMMMDGKDASQIADTVDAFKTIIATRCAEDAWTAAARECLAAMRTQGDAERCSTLLTDEQQANLVRDQKAKFGAGPNEQTDAAAPPPEPSGGGVVPPPPPPAAAPAAAAPEAAPAKPADAKKKSSPRKPSRTGDPCDGGE